MGRMSELDIGIRIMLEAEAQEMGLDAEDTRLYTEANYDQYAEELLRATAQATLNTRGKVNSNA